MNRKQVDAQIKAIDAERGIVTSVVAVFGNVDAQNDVIIPGAFTRTIAKWKARMTTGQFLPVVYGHKDDPDYTIGKVIDMRQTAEGLEADEQYFLTKPKARSAFDNIKAGVLPGSSFAYDILKGKSNQHGGLDLGELDVIEVGPTTYPANDATRLVGVKDGGGKPAAEPLDDDVVRAFGSALTEAFTKAGRTVSAASERRVRDHLASLKDQVAGLEAWLDELTVAGDKTEEPEEAKVDDHPLKTAVRSQMEAVFAVSEVA